MAARTAAAPRSRAALRRPRAPRPAARPRRGTAAETRDRLLAAAASELNRVGYHGTDSNQLARAAGYAPGTFYKHFPDKLALFLAVYERWVTTEWTRVEAIVHRGGSAAALAGAILASVLDMHRAWRGLRASLRALVATDATARSFYRAQRRRQLTRLAALRAPRGGAHTVDDALLLFTLERTCDAIADGELQELGISPAVMAARLRTVIAAHIGGRARRERSTPRSAARR